jgi:Xaa-Pro aminopeptidase
MMATGLVDLGILRGVPDDLVDLGAASVFFPHGLGHLLGLDVHDMEDMGDRAGYGPGRSRSEHVAQASLRLDRILKPGMVVTVEPGFYQVPMLLERARGDARISTMVNWTQLERFADVRGIRIEDDVLITSGAPDVLSKEAPKEISELEEARQAS